MQPGDTCETRGVVTGADTAASIGSGGLPVLGTPRMIAMMENAAYSLLQRELPESKTSVGTRLDVSHLSPSPVGMNVRAEATVTSVSDDGRTVEFSVSAWDDAGLIGKGFHRRVILDVSRFLEKSERKLKDKEN